MPVINHPDTHSFSKILLSTNYNLRNSAMSSSLSSIPVKKKRGGKKPPNNYIPKGDILTDSHKQVWIIHKSIGRGGFGEIYTASSARDKNQQNYVIKIEPSENGPLFCEKTVYIRIGKFEDIKDYMSAKGLKSLGMPKFFGSGIHSTDGKKFRFLVMERYGKDLWSIFLENKRKFPPSTTFKVGLQVLDVLEYIHSKGYAHSDIKGANLLLGCTKNDENQVYLVDFGLASKYTSQLKSDPRRAHNGTIEYTSRDGHNGLVTRRGDIEILGYNLLHWTSSNLPWEGSTDVYEVQKQKEKYMRDSSHLLKACYNGKPSNRTLEKYFIYLIDAHPLVEPNYELLKQYLREGIKRIGDTSNKLDFCSLKTKSNDATRSSRPPPVKIRKTAKRIAVNKSKAKSSTTETDCALDTSTDEECDDDDDDQDNDEDDDDEEDDDDDFIDSTPEKSPVKYKKKTTRSWKDCDTVVSCAELLNKGTTTLRRSKRTK